ncbi:hypothetical protein FF2_031986 [Malus domestica]
MDKFSNLAFHSRIGVLEVVFVLLSSSGVEIYPWLDARVLGISGMKIPDVVHNDPNVIAEVLLNCKVLVSLRTASRSLGQGFGHREIPVRGVAKVA